MRDLLLLVGPTGSGKTAVAIEICDLLDGEIVSADSMQIYRGLDIATAKPTAEEQRRARHHIIDIIEPGAPYSAAQWAADARAAIADIVARNKTPILAGGTGFYLRALLQPERLGVAPPDPAFRASLEAQAAAGGTSLHDSLRETDPAAAGRLHPNDVHRVIRALEIARNHTPPSLPAVKAEFRPWSWGLAMPRELLYRRLEQRIDAMLQGGALNELQTLLARGLPPDSVVLQGVGYRQMAPALAEPGLTDGCIEEWKRATRRYAKRQMTWFRHQLSVRWIAIDDRTAPRETAETIAAEWSSRGG